jgi:hypothetical protein
MSKPNSSSGSDHGTHARGLGSLLGIGHSPMSLLNGLSSSYLLNYNKNSRVGEVSGPARSLMGTLENP